MNVTENDNHQLIDGATTAVDMLVDGRLSAVMVIGVYNDGRGYKLWTGGEPKVGDILRARLLDALPLPPSRRPAEENDGA